MSLRDLCKRGRLYINIFFPLCILELVMIDFLYTFDKKARERLQNMTKSITEQQKENNLTAIWCC